MSTSVSSELINMQNVTQQTKATQNANATSKSSSSVNSQEFLFLLTEQLKYQDPMNPMDNSQMLAQEAQFATLEQMEALTSSFSQFSSIYQANALLGQNVEVTVDGKASSGVIDYVDYSDTSGASVSIGGKMYPISSITKVYPDGVSSDGTSDKDFFKMAMGYIADGVDNIYNSIKGTSSSEGTTNNTTQNSN